MNDPAIGVATPSPFPSQLQDPLLIVLDRVTNQTPNVFVQRTSLLDDIIREAGFDPANLPPNWDRTKRLGGGAGIDRNIAQAFHYAHVRRNPPLTVNGSARGQWGITEAGIQAVREMKGLPVVPAPSTPPGGSQRPATPPKRGTPASAPNETAEWLAEHLAGGTTGRLYRTMRAALSRRLPVSAAAHLLEDHIQNFMLRAIRRNAFRKLLADGGSVPYSKVVAYCVNSGRTDARDMGTEPICREMLGARTERERREKREANNEDELIDDRSRAWDTDGNILVPDDGQSNDSNDIDFDLVWKQIENIVHEEKPNAWERYSGIIAMKANGLTTKEIARAEGVSRNRAASMLAEARRVVRSGFSGNRLDGFLTFAQGV